MTRGDKVSCEGVIGWWLGQETRGDKLLSRVWDRQDGRLDTKHNQKEKREGEGEGEGEKSRNEGEERKEERGGEERGRRKPDGGEEERGWERNE